MPSSCCWHICGDPREIAGAARTVALANFLFTASAVILRAITGTWLAWSGGYSLHDGWIVASIALYVVTGPFGCGGVDADADARSAIHAVETGTKLPSAYHRLFHWWFAFGFPAFAAVLLYLLADDCTAGHSLLGLDQDY